MYAPSAQPAPLAESSILDGLWWHGTGNAAQLVPWLVKNVLPETGVALIPGQWGMGKTFVALELSDAVACGRTFANYKCKRPGGVLYLAAEGAAVIPSRLDAIARKHHMEHRGRLPLAMLDWCPQFLPPQKLPAFGLLDFCIAVAAKMQEVHGVPLVLIVIDTLSAAHPFKDANDAAEAQKVMNYLADVSRQTGALVAAVDHYGKALEAGTRGSSAKEASADAIIAVLGERSDAGIISKTRIALRKVRGGKQGEETFFTLPPMQLGTDEDNEPIVQATVKWSPVTAPTEVPKQVGDGWPNKPAVRVFRAALGSALARYGRVEQPILEQLPVRVVELARVKEEFNARYPNDETKDGKRKAWKRAIETLSGGRVVRFREVVSPPPYRPVELVWLAKPDIQADGQDTPLVSLSGPSATGQRT